jgi:predicted transcriptional regulator of viral defense system
MNGTKEEGIYTFLLARPSITARAHMRGASNHCYTGMYTCVAFMSKERLSVLVEQFMQGLSNSNKHIYSPAEILSLIVQLRAEHTFPRSLSDRKFQKSLIELGTLKEISFTASYSFETTRYHFGPFSDYELALSLKPGAYLSHGTAGHLHNLIDQKPKLIHVNKEQSPKNSKGTLTQAAIHRAFANKQRISAYIVRHEQIEMILLSGKHSGRLGVTKSIGRQGEQLDLTDLERTLIDLAVRPSYAGGASAVAKAYRRAMPKLSISRIAKLLKELNYVYPYHQAIGFYLQNAGQPLSALQPLREPSLNFDFYLEHGMKQPAFDSTWRVHFADDSSR